MIVALKPCPHCGVALVSAGEGDDGFTHPISTTCWAGGQYVPAWAVDSWNNRPGDMRELLVKMFSGWINYEASYVVGPDNKLHPTTTQEAAMLEACGGDAREAVLLQLFGHWSNDVIGMAAHYGVALARAQPDGTLLHDDGTVDTLMKGGKLTILSIEPPPSPAHFWHAGKWQLLDEPLFKGELPAPPSVQ